MIAAIDHPLAHFDLPFLDLIHIKSVFWTSVK